MDNITLKVRRSMGAASFTYSWKNSVGKPSCPRALPLGREEMASMTSSRVKVRVMSVFIASVTRTGMLS